ncbi:MAG TPA: AsmA family protein, partial [Burkholderiales bacterium]|nr:AsmA family protein [Burkholderiales bacterium]
MKWLKRIGIALIVLLVIAAAIPFFVNLDDFIPRIEREASAKLKEPVTVKSLKFSMLPVPHINVDGISVGKTQDVTLGTVTVTPAVLSLLSATKVIRSIELKSLVLTQKALDKIPVWSKTERTDAPPLVRIESIRLDNALIKLDKNSFGPFDARVTLDSQGEPLEALITTQDGKLKASVKPDKSNYLIDAAAKGWKPPVGPPIEFDELIIKGVATLNNADFSQISAKLYGGTVNGKGTAAWQKGLQVKGNFDINQVELKSLVPL